MVKNKAPIWNASEFEEGFSPACRRTVQQDADQHGRPVFKEWLAEVIRATVNL